MKKIVISTALLSLFLSGCGTTGDLNAAPPMWGKAKQEYKAKKKQEEQKAQQQKQSDQK